MPLYEYACAACRDRFEILQAIGENGDALSCPSCGHHEVTKQFSTFSGVSVGAASARAFEAGCGAPNCCSARGSGCET